MNEETNNIELDGDTVNAEQQQQQQQQMKAASSNHGGGDGGDTNIPLPTLVSVLTIRRPSRDDSRVYVCKASNDYGWAELKIRLLVKGECCLLVLGACVYTTTTIVVALHLKRREW